MIEKPAKDIVREIVESNPFWEHFICIKGEIKVTGGQVPRHVQE